MNDEERELARLVAEERAATGPIPAERKARMLARVAATVGLPPVPPPPPPAGLVAAGKGTALLATKVVAAVTLAVGAGVALLGPGTPPPRSAPASAPASVPAEPPRPSPPTITAGPLQVAPLPEPASPAQPRKRPRPPAPDAELAAERALLETARAALARGEVDAAETALGTYAGRFPAGRLAEERDALRVQSALRAGHLDRARRLLDAFARDHRDSLLLEPLRRAVDSVTESPPDRQPRVGPSEGIP